MLNNYISLTKMSLNPLIYSSMVFFLINTLNNFFWTKNKNLFVMLLSVMIFMMFLNFSNFNNLMKENLIMGFLSKKKMMTVYNGFMIFIMSELMVFISLFWSYIHNSFTLNIYMGNFWPPKGLITANPTSMIIFGTVMLLSSSIIIMISHMNFINKNNKMKTIYYLIMCLIMGLVFVDMQILEMSNMFMKLNFNLNDSIFSSTFLITTSLHATHVMLGLVALMFSTKMVKKNFNNSYFMFSFETSIWYWHFVDYIWIVVFTLFYYLNN